MCKAWPGPRCTNHAKKQLLAAQASLKELEAKGERNEALMKAHLDHAKALEEWDATPGGQKALKAAIASKEEACQAILDREGVTSKYQLSDEARKECFPLDDQVGTLKYRLMQGKELRKKRNDLYKFHQRHAEGERFPLNERWDRDMKLDSSWQTSDGDEMRVYNLQPSYRNADYAKCAWRVRNGEPVAMVRFFDSTYTGYGEHPVLCDIEVSPFYRGDGLGLKTVRELDSKYGQLHTSGSYSVSGHRSLAKHVPLYEGAQESISPTTTHYEFVDWQEGDLARW